MEDFDKIDNPIDVEDTSVNNDIFIDEKVEDIFVVPKPTPPSADKTNKGKSNFEEVVIYSLRDVYKENLLVAPKGYTKIKKDDAEELLKNRKVRLASEEEIKEYFNK